MIWSKMLEDQHFKSFDKALKQVDSLLIKNKLISKILDYEFYVYNRWGELIFESYNPGVGWDGPISLLRLANELNTSFVLSGTDLEITDAGGLINSLN